jgi:site-specific recombinase XerD
VTRVPKTGPAERERLDCIRRLERSLRRFEKVPAHRREAECADVGERDCRALLTELGAPGSERSAAPMVATVMTIDKWLDGEESCR